MKPVINWLRRRRGPADPADVPVSDSVLATGLPGVADVLEPVLPSGPPVPFQPRGDLAPLFFLHIPKTSGSSVNRLLEIVYGTGNLISHAEYLLPKLLDRTEPTQRLDCVSAHVPLCRWSLYSGSDAYARATMLRDPWERLVSHVNWTNRFNAGEPLPASDSGAGAMQRVVTGLAETDFQSGDSLQRLFDLVQAEPEFIHFDNLQVRMLTTGNPRSDMARPDPTTLRRAQGNLRKFAFWGICEDQMAFQARLLAATGSTAMPRPIHENVGRPLALTADNALARKVFAPWIDLDQALYDGAVTVQRTRDRRARGAQP